MKEEAYYSSKPLACSSPIIEVIDGQEYRIHDGYYIGDHRLVGPTKYLVSSMTPDLEKDEEMHTLRTINVTKTMNWRNKNA